MVYGLKVRVEHSTSPSVAAQPKSFRRSHLPPDPSSLGQQHLLCLLLHERSIEERKQAAEFAAVNAYSREPSPGQTSRSSCESLVCQSRSAARWGLHAVRGACLSLLPCMKAALALWRPHGPPPCSISNHELLERQSSESHP